MNLSLSGGTEGYAGINAKLKLPDGINVSSITRGALLTADLSTDWRTGFR